MSDTSRDQLLDGWRGISVLAVLFGHAIRFRFGPYFPAPAINDILRDSQSTGLLFTYFINRFAEVCAATGVQIFFVISGYIITTLLIKERHERGRISLPAFYIRRTFRILPPFFVYLGTCWLLSTAAFISMSNADFLAAATFTCNLPLLPYGWFVSHIWSLSIEEQFYLIWPMIVLALPIRARTSALIVILTAFTLLTLFRLSPRNSVSFACIAIGALYACSPSLERLIKSRTSLWGIAIVLLTLFASNYLHSLKIVYSLIQCLLPFGILYVVFAARHLPSTRSLLETALIGRIGLISYSLYLWQQLFLAWPTEYLRVIPPLWLLPVVAIASFFFLERPMIAIGRRLSKKFQSHQPSPSATIKTNGKLLTLHDA